MIGTRVSRAVLCLAALCLAVVGVLLPDAHTVYAKPHGETPDEANEFLDRFIGQWRGEGTANGVPIKSDLACERVFEDNTFLRMADREIEGANFQADTYVGYRVETKRYELYTFNNNTAFGSSLPFRFMTGRRAGDKLVMEEKRGPGALRYTFEFLDEDTFRLTKSLVEGHHEPPIVIETYRRQ